jgi:hypothetical protein
MRLSISLLVTSESQDNGVFSFNTDGKRGWGNAECGILISRGICPRLDITICLYDSKRDIYEVESGTGVEGLNYASAFSRE